MTITISTDSMENPKKNEKELSGAVRKSTWTSAFSSRSRDQMSTKVSPTPRRAEAVEAPWPKESSGSLPPLPQHLKERLKKGVRFPINEDCTALSLTPSGRFLLGAFTDGTVRLFDLSGHFKKPEQGSSRDSKQLSVPRRMVLSKNFLHFGAVCCQLQAKGVHTSLLMDVDISEDGLWCFAGALRGSMELLAIHLGRVEAAVASARDADGTGTNILDFVTVHRHSDAKLRGFGACTRLKMPGRPKYLLFTGKAIKNIHVWSFEPPAESGGEAVFQELYNTQTNGSTIKMLQFGRGIAGQLIGISKSEGTKLRVWDLSHEESAVEEDNVKEDSRPQRPPFQDVPNTEATLGLAGSYCLCGGNEIFNQMSMVSLNADNLQSLFNQTEIALPGVSPVTSRRRQQRGDLKCIEHVDGMVFDAGHAILSLSDGSLVHFQQEEPHGLPTLKEMPNDTPGLGILPENATRRICITRLGSQGLAVAAVAAYSQIKSKGNIFIYPLDQIDCVASLGQHRSGFWGFTDYQGLSALAGSPNYNNTSDRISALGPSYTPAATVITPRAHDAKLSSTIQSAHEFGDSLPLARRLASTASFEMTQQRIDSPADAGLPRAEDRDQIPLSAEGVSQPRPARVSLGEVVVKRMMVARGTKVATVTHSSDWPKRKTTEKRQGSPVHMSIAMPRSAPLKQRSEGESDHPKPADVIDELDEDLANAGVADESTPQSRGGLGRSGAQSTDSEQPGAVTEGLLDIPTKTKSPCKRSPTRSSAKRDDLAVGKSILEKCLIQQRRIRSDLDNLPRSTVSKRMGLHVTPPSGKEQAQEFARRKLAAEHRAAHEMIQKRVLRAVEVVLQGLQTSPTPRSLEEAKSLLRESILSIGDQVEESLYRQELEASTLAAKQSLDTVGGEAPLVAVSFPFPGIFQHAINSLPDV